MKYKKVIIFFMLILGAAAFCKIGVQYGKSKVSAEQKVYTADDERKAGESGKIAVVNLDEGVSGEEGQTNYAEKLSKFPSIDFEYSSLEAARIGLETGKYGAYVIIPATFSHNVESINTIPQTSQLEYVVNQTYSGEKQYELLYKVLNYIDSLNNHLSYMYVDNILKEFHEVQDGADHVLENDRKDKAAIEKIQAQSLVTLAEIPRMKAEENTDKVVDVTDYMSENVMLAESANEEYERYVRDIQAEISSLNADGNELLESLENLSGQVSDLNFGTDENGVDIAEKADIQFRTEFKKQLEGTLDKESVVQHFIKLKDNNEELLKRCKELNVDIVPFIEDENQEIDTFIEEIEKAENIDIDRVSELVKKEYVEPFEFNADTIKKTYQQKYKEEIAAISLYNEKLSSFHPETNTPVILQNTHRMADNQGFIQKAISENNQVYRENTKRMITSITEYAEELQRYMAEVKQESDKMVTEGLSEAREVKKRTSSDNQKILADFVSKLSYTRIGSAEYAQAYQFIAEPLKAVDLSMKPGGRQAEDKARVHAASPIVVRKELTEPGIYVVSGILLVVLLVQVYFFIRRKRAYEY